MKRSAFEVLMMWPVDDQMIKAPKELKKVTLYVWKRWQDRGKPGEDEHSKCVEHNNMRSRKVSCSKENLKRSIIRFGWRVRLCIARN